MSPNEEKIEDVTEIKVDGKCEYYSDCSDTDCSECESSSDSDIDPYHTDTSDDFKSHLKEINKFKYKLELYKDETKIKFGRIANELISILIDYNLIEECEPAAFDILNLIISHDIVEGDKK